MKKTVFTTAIFPKILALSVTMIFVTQFFSSCDDKPVDDNGKTIRDKIASLLGLYGKALEWKDLSEKNPTEFNKNKYIGEIIQHLEADSVDFYTLIDVNEIISKLKNAEIDWSDKHIKPKTPNDPENYVYHNSILHDLWKRAGKPPMSGYVAQTKLDSTLLAADGYPGIEVRKERPAIEPPEDDIYPIDNADKLDAWLPTIQEKLENPEYGAAQQVSLIGTMILKTDRDVENLLGLLKIISDKLSLNINDFAIAPGADKLMLPKELIDLIKMHNIKIAANGNNKFHVGPSSNTDGLQIDTGVKVGVNKLENPTQTDMAKMTQDTTYVTANNYDISVLANLPVSTAVKYILMLEDGKSVKVSNAAIFNRLEEPTAKPTNADIKALKGLTYSEIVSSIWGIGPGTNQLAERLIWNPANLNTKIVSATNGTEAGQITIGNISTEDFLGQTLKVISMGGALPVNHQLRMPRGDYLDWDFNTNGIFMVVENPTARGDFVNMVFEEVYGTSDYDIFSGFLEPLIPQTAQKNDIANNRYVIKLNEVLGIILITNSSNQYNMYDGWMKTLIWTTSNGLTFGSNYYPGYYQNFTQPPYGSPENTEP